MPVIAIFSASHCHADQVARGVADKLGYKLLSTQELVSIASSSFKVAQEKLLRTMHGPRSVFDRLTREKGHNVAYLRSGLGELIKGEQVVYHGFAGHLLPRTLTQVLRVCLVAKADFRVKLAQEEGLPQKDARKLVAKEDESRKQWTLHLFGLSPWDKSLYDILIPMDSTSVEDAVSEICENAMKPPLQSTPASGKAMQDFLLDCRVGVVLVEGGHDVEVKSSAGEVGLTINRYVMRLESYEKELKKIVAAIPGVKKVTTKVGPHYNQPNIYPKLDLPKKILLVDDEKEFVHTLSERLQTRNLESAVAYDGEEALEIMQTDAPEVMVLDLKMPGIDGLEVLRRVKKEHPGTEVIILTGHGSEQERKLADELGAFAYLQKPVDIDLLAETMKKAYAKVAESKDTQPPEEGGS